MLKISHISDKWKKYCLGDFSPKNDAEKKWKKITYIVLKKWFFFTVKWFFYTYKIIVLGDLLPKNDAEKTYFK